MTMIFQPLTRFVLGCFLLAASPAMSDVTMGTDQTALTPSLAPIVETVAPGVVSISVSSHQTADNPIFSDPFFRQFFDFLPQDVPLERLIEASGSGVVVDAEAGLVLTNAHVLENATRISVHLADGREFLAEIRGIDEETDIAALTIKAENLRALTIGRSGRLRVGDYVLAVGNPFGLKGTVTLGIVSALGRSGLGIEGYENFIQVDAAINPGNSGGALVNLRGELVGINTAIAGPSGANVGIGFAIPIDMAMQVASQLIEYGRVYRGQIGVMVQDLSPDLAEAFGVKAPDGVVITDIVPGSPAEAAGLIPGDIIFSLDGEPVANAAALRLAASLKRPGQEVTIGLHREGKPQDVRVILGSPDGDGTEDKIPPTPPHSAARLAGATLKALSASEAPGGIQGGVLVEQLDADSPMSDAGLRSGDVIVEANGKPVHDPDELNEAAEQAGGPLILRVYRLGRAFFAAIS